MRTLRFLTYVLYKNLYIYIYICICRCTYLRAYICVSVLILRGEGAEGGESLDLVGNPSMRSMPMKDAAQQGPHTVPTPEGPDISLPL